MGRLPKSSVGEFDMVGDFSIPQGATRIIQLFIYQGGIITDFSSGYTAKLQVRQGYNLPVILELTTVDGSIVLSSGATNTPNCTLNFTPAKTLNASAFTELIYDLAIYNNNGTILKFLQGGFEITKRVTQ
jgi:hypothetical protein